MRIIAGRWKGHRLQSLRGKGVRPTTDRVREAWMAAMGSAVEDARVLDPFAGSGALGLEALSRGAREVVFVEKARGALATLQANIRLLGAEEECRIVRGDAMAYARRLKPDSFDLALADPPYEVDVARRLVECGVPYITINYKGWDTHKQHFPQMRRKLPEMDGGMATLLQDLSDRGLLDSTIVCWTGEFGRTPKVQWEAPWNGGRGHHGRVFSSVVAGGGFKGGRVVGASDATGEDQVYVIDQSGNGEPEQLTKDFAGMLLFSSCMRRAMLMGTSSEVRRSRTCSRQAAMRAATSST